MEQPAKRLQQIARRCLERAHELEAKVFRHHLRVMEERKHLQQGTPERSYYTAGYLQALKDVRGLIGDGEFSVPLHIDGGPRIAPQDTRLETSTPIRSDMAEVMCLNCSVNPAQPTLGKVPLCTECAKLCTDTRGVAYDKIHPKNPTPEAP